MAQMPNRLISVRDAVLYEMLLGKRSDDDKLSNYYQPLGQVKASARDLESIHSEQLVNYITRASSFRDEVGIFVILNRKKKRT